MTTITPATLPGQLPQQRYGVDEDGNVYLFSAAMGDRWLPENDATRMAREARAAGYRVPLPTWLDRNGRPNALRGF